MKALAVAVAVLALGCAPQAFISSAGDYSAYRATRVGKTLEDRLAAAQRYLAERPHGAFRDEVRAYFEPAEQAFYAAQKGSRSGLEAYLRVLPSGPHGVQARVDLDGLELSARRQHEDVDRAAADAEARAAGPGAIERARVKREVADWVARFLDPKVFRAPMAEAKANLVVAWSLALPSPRCAPIVPPRGRATRRCEKLLELKYSVISREAPEPREALLAITVLEDPAGTPLEATIGGPDLFLRLEETHRVQPLSPGDDEARDAAATRVINLVRDAFAREVSPDPACRRRSTEAELTHRACEGIRVVARTTAGEDDQIVISPL